MKAEPRNNLVLVGGVQPPLAAVLQGSGRAEKGSAAEVCREG